MAIVISDTNDKRKQVNLNLQKVSLTPTVQPQSGPTTRVQDISPIVKQGEQFLNNFKNLTKVYSQAVDVFTEEGKRKASELDEEGFNKALEEISGDSFSVFGKTKAYNEGLVERYFATEVPKKLQEIDADLKSNLTQYGTPEEFEAASAQKLEEYFDEVRDTFSENVFSSRALNAYTAVTKSKFLLKANEGYLEAIDAFNTEEANNKAYRAVSDLATSSIGLSDGGLQDTLTLTDNKLTVTIPEAQERAKIITGSVIGEIGTAIKSKDFVRADELLDLIEDDEFKINGVALFNTASTGNQIKVLRAQYNEQKLIDDKNFITITQPKVVAELNNDLHSMSRQLGEDATMDFIESKLNEIDDGKLTLGDEVYTDERILFEARKQYNSAKGNTTIFKTLWDDEIAKLSSTELDSYTSDILNPAAIKTIVRDENMNVALFFGEYTDEMNELHIGKGAPTQALLEAISNVEIYKNDLVKDILKELPTEGLTINEKVQFVRDRLIEMEFQTLIKDKLMSELRNITPDETQANEQIEIIADLKAKGYTKDEIDQIKFTEGNNFVPAATEALRREEAEDSYYNIGSDGNVSTRGLFVNDRYASFLEANEEGAFISSENKLEEHSKVAKKINNKGLGNFLFYSIINTRLGDFREKSNGYTKIMKTIQTVGINQDDLLNGKIIATPNDTNGMLYMQADPNNGRVNIHTLIAQKRISFDTFGIQLNKSFKKTIQAIEAFEADFTVDSTMKAIADKYGIDVSELYALQRQYFEQNGYLK